MRIVFLGTGTAIPLKERRCAGIYLESEGRRILLDMGVGVLGRLAEAGIDYLSLSAIFITHFHPDHILDLFAYLFALRNPDYPRQKPLYLFGAKGLKELLEKMNQIFSGWFLPRGYELILEELPLKRAHQILWQGVKITSLPVFHSSSSIGYRFELEGKVIAYSGDCGDCPELRELGAGADLLILEASWSEEKETKEHLTPAQAGKIAQESEAKRLALVHFYPRVLETDIKSQVEEHFSGRVIIAEDLLEIFL